MTERTSINGAVKSPREKLQELLVKRIADKQEPSKSNVHVVTIQELADHSTPLVCILGGGAGVNTYRRLSQLLPGQAMYALQLGRHDDPNSHWDTIDGMADWCFELLREHIPGDRYFLCGLSIGATIAYGLTLKLQRAGYDVAALIIIDQPAPGLRVTVSRWLFWQWASIAHLPWRMRLHYVIDGIRHRIVTSRRLPARVRRLFVSNKWGNPRSEQNKSTSASEYRRRAADISIQALRTYRPEPCDVPCTLIRASQGGPRVLADPYGGWAALVRGNLQVVNVPGTHMTLFRDENLPKIAAIIEAALSDQMMNLRDG